MHTSEESYGKDTALNDVTFSVGTGRIVGLLGPNGSGKTTLIKLMNGLLQPTEGEVKIKGKAPGIDSKSIISYLPDKMYFADWMKVSDLLDFFSLWHYFQGSFFRSNNRSARICKSKHFF